MSVSQENLRKIEFYDQHYEIVVIYPLVDARLKRIRDHSNENERKCRFCGKSKPEVSFREVAHAIPEFLGNKSLILSNECDACNAFFANEYEDHLAKWFGPMRTLCAMRGKEGIPKYKSKRLSAKRSNRGTELSMYADSSSVNITSGASFKIPVEMPTQPYIPLRAAQALIKSAISVLPKEFLSECENTILWLLRKGDLRVHQFPVLYAFTPGLNPHQGGRAMICRRKDPDARMPYMWFALAATNFTFQVMIPFCKSDRWIQEGKNNFTAMTFPTPFSKEYEEQFGRTTWRCEDWAQDQPTIQNRSVSFQVDRVEEDNS